MYTRTISVPLMKPYLKGPAQVPLFTHSPLSIHQALTGGDTESVLEVTQVEDLSLKIMSKLVIFILVIVTIAGSHAAPGK